MDLINTLLGVPLGYVMHLAYVATDNLGLAIVVFAVLAKIILFPVSILAHKNSIRLLQIQPDLTALKRRFGGDRERLSEEQYNLFKKEKYSPLLGIVPLMIRLLLIVGIMQVIYRPLQHILRFNQESIDALVSAGRELYGMQSGPGEQLQVLAAFQQDPDSSRFYDALANLPYASEILQKMQAVDLNFLGINLGQTPSFTEPSAALLIPLLSGLTALVFCLLQSAISPGALSQSKNTNWALTIFTVALSLYFAIVTPVGVGLYWTLGNVLAIISVLLLNLMYNPKKLAGEALSFIDVSRKTPAQTQKDKKREKELKIREKKDASAFLSAEKNLVFYAITSGQYKFYRQIINHLLEHSDIKIHYLTNDPDDALFKQDNARLIPYYASQKKTISLMMKLDTDIVVTTVPDLQSYHLKRSIVRSDIEYIFTRHGLGSMHMATREKAYDHFDTIFCAGPHNVAEIRKREEMAGLPRKNLVKVGYGLYDQLKAAYDGLQQNQPNKKPRILIAPSWQDDNILDLCIDQILTELFGKGFEIFIRPHPQFLRIFPERIEALKKRYSVQVAGGELVFEDDFSSNESILLSDVLITDWSDIGAEFSYSTLRPSIFINTPMKIMNPNYKDFDLEVLDIALRDKVGVSLDPDKLAHLADLVDELISEKDEYQSRIKTVVEHYLYYPGRSGEAGGTYILRQLEARGAIQDSTQDTSKNFEGEKG